MLPTEPRLPEVLRLIGQKHYFVLHAPRRVGKTTTLLQLAEKLTAESTYAAVLLSMEAGASLHKAEQMGAAEDAILATWQQQARDRFPPPFCPRRRGRRALRGAR